MRVVVIGGGLAGLSAAIALQERRHDVTLIERRGILGGRATSFRDSVTGDTVDNGTHVMIGAYRATLALLRRAGALDSVDQQETLHIDYREDHGVTRLACPPIIAPLHLLMGLIGMRLPWRSRFDALRFALHMRFGRIPSGMTLAACFDERKQSARTRRWLWDPLATAILNETAARADARVFQAVFREAFLKTADASALIFFRRGLADVMERLAAYFAGRGGVIERRATAELVEIEDGRVSAVRYHGLAGGSARQSQRIAAEAAVIATPWHTVAPLLPHALQTSEPFAKLKELRATPIVSVELWLDRPIVQERMVGLREASIDWIFDKGRLLGRLGTPQHLSFVLSAATRDLTRTNADLIDLAKMTLLRFYPGMSEAQVVRALVLREPQATFTCEPAAADLRPGPVTPIRGLVLAGDWTDTGLPATIEGAVRSGAAAAVAIPRSYA